MLDFHAASGDLLLIIDGYDELFSRNNQRRFSKLLHDYLSEADNVHLLLTSRIVSFIKDDYADKESINYIMSIPGIRRNIIKELDEESKEVFIRKWHQALFPFDPEKKKTADSIIAQLKLPAFAYLRTMTSVPLHLSNILFVARVTNRIPTNKVQLYEEYIGVSLNWHATGNLEADEIKTQLAYVAYYMIDREILVYERISKKLAYSNHSDVRDHNIVGPVLLSSGVCEGHNALLLLCFRRIGIPCIKVYGRTKTDGWHCWTIAWINGIPVHCDVTWDGTEEGLVRFDYLNLSDNQISGDHYDFKCARVPECTSETLSYYSYRGLCVHSFNDLKTRLKKDSQRGISPILIHFSYRPASGDCLKEAQRAFSEERISGNHRLYYHPTLKNLAVK